MVKLIREFDERPSRRRRMTEETEWTQVGPGERNKVRRALKNNGIGIERTYTDEEQSRADGVDNIRIRTIFTTDLDAYDSYEKPAELEDAVREIKASLGRGYSVLTMPNKEDIWEISVTKLMAESATRSSKKRDIKESLSSPEMTYVPIKRRDCGDSECVVFAELEDVDDPIDVYFCATLPYDWENSEYDPNTGSVDGFVTYSRKEADRWLNSN